MTSSLRDLAGMSPADATEHVIERRPAKIVTALRIDLDPPAKPQPPLPSRDSE